ncbi:hypothetical protein D7Z26_15160 [Cohnella endophytica]|uniref:ABC transporter permease n=1 Tax=Cohnella endophytica TaxID=2419778 RepID=A0A494XTD5_9BACL|nr:ABC-2 family transporter protein [Cohnella endophytica]RKP53072.1 hypothetical protein D7Z26_15160 [Cohnella endophytica]
MRLYRAVLLRSFQSNTAYRAETVMKFFFSLLQILIQTSIWIALYGRDNVHSSSVGDVSLREMLTYTILGICVQIVVGNDIIWRLGSKIQSGEIASDLIKPIPFARFMFAESGGQTLFRIVFEMVPIVAFGFFAYGLLFPSAADLGLFLLCLLNGIALYYLMSFIVGLFAFWYMVYWHSGSLFHVVMSLFSGSMLPLWFFPESFIRVAQFLPFQLVFYGPISVFVGKTTFLETLRLVGMQFVWIAILSFGLKWVWSKAWRKLVIQGG